MSASEKWSATTWIPLLLMLHTFLLHYTNFTGRWVRGRSCAAYETQQWFIERNGAKIKLSATREIWKYKNTRASRQVIKKYDKLALSYSQNWLIIIAQNWIPSLLINIEELLETTLIWVGGPKNEFIPFPFWNHVNSEFSFGSILRELDLQNTSSVVCSFWRSKHQSQIQEKGARWRHVAESSQSIHWRLPITKLHCLICSLVSWFQVSTSPTQYRFMLVNILLPLFGECSTVEVETLKKIALVDMPLETGTKKLGWSHFHCSCKLPTISPILVSLKFSLSSN